MSHAYWIGLSLALGLALFGPEPVLAQGAADQGAAEISAYAQSVASLVEPYKCDDNGDDGYDEEAHDENDSAT